MLVDKDLNDVKPPYIAADGTQYPRSITRDFSDAELAALGWYRLYLDNRPEGMVTAERGPREWRGDPQTAWQTWTATPIPATREAVTTELNRRLVETTVVALDDGRFIPVDTRDDTDLIRITALFNNAGLMKSIGRSDPITWLGADHAEYSLDIDQQAEMPAKVFAHQQTLIRASHAVKRQIAAGTLANAAEIPAAFDAILRPAP